MLCAALVLSLSACGGKKDAPQETAETETEALVETRASSEESSEAEPAAGTAAGQTLSPFQNFMESSIEQKENETTLSNAEKESIKASEKAVRRAEKESAAAAESARQAAIDASIAAEEQQQAAIDASIAESERIQESIEESMAEEEMRLMNESADAETAGEANSGPGFSMNAPTVESPAAPGQ